MELCVESKKFDEYFDTYWRMYEKLKEYKDKYECAMNDINSLGINLVEDLCGRYIKSIIHDKDSDFVYLCHTTKIQKLDRTTIVLSGNGIHFGIYKNKEDLSIYVYGETSLHIDISSKDNFLKALRNLEIITEEEFTSRMTVYKNAINEFRHE